VCIPGAALRCRSAFSPLDGFMDEETYTHCVDNMRLKARARRCNTHARIR
jgi:hypothetical protein